MIGRDICHHCGEERESGLALGIPENGPGHRDRHLHSAEGVASGHERRDHQSFWDIAGVREIVQRGAEEAESGIDLGHVLQGAEEAETETENESVPQGACRHELAPAEETGLFAEETGVSAEERLARYGHFAVAEG